MSVRRYIPAHELQHAIQRGRDGYYFASIQKFEWSPNEDDAYGWAHRHEAEKFLNLHWPLAIANKAFGAKIQVVPIRRKS